MVYFLLFVGVSNRLSDELDTMPYCARFVAESANNTSTCIRDQRIVNLSYIDDYLVEFYK
ncbi:hypothetical protein AtNW77_Chr3g0215391 [Arabidopsis thaliana]|uniref:Uncharacterized protein n=4 Tax=Arabidopsis TaxID=3701 RepID=A0A5S9XM35_ARATH|nr:uncharacterized protein AT3G58877 [Arabidopsis thaliana]AEE79842.1 hypothetical protein AT3G58877 [Arabidopsis thaliana]KAG7629018.1 hypothetical protein ISN45_At03g051910 [Arabidopsis thaliana x Arabidopsis arenosa]KAG7634934.1 hypothetical protein ISN44_As03g050730 [Arabidopsis suecica]CAA0387313.1 unnamed protein product [Arabidopsis thaliana]|eukprot:NP_001118856.1 hypothetical protein AT3G58877 [Arabidopsis thaliana]